MTAAYYPCLLFSPHSFIHSLKYRRADGEGQLLIRLIERSAKAYDTVELAKLFRGMYHLLLSILSILSLSLSLSRVSVKLTKITGATPKAIEERIAKLKREAKAAIASESDAPSGPASSPKSHAPHRAGKKRARATGGDGGVGKRGAGKRKKTKTMNGEGAREGEDDDEVKGEREGGDSEGAGGRAEGEGEGGVKRHVATVERDPDETEEENVEQGVGREVKMELA
jgi:hypothetical protein